MSRTMPTRFLSQDRESGPCMGGFPRRPLRHRGRLKCKNLMGCKEMLCLASMAALFCEAAGSSGPAMGVKYNGLAKTRSLNPSEMNRLGYGIKGSRRQQTWNSSTFYDPEYVEFMDYEPNVSLESREYGVGEGNYSGSSLYGLQKNVLHATTDEWPRKAGSWGTVQSGPLSGVLRILGQQERDFHQHLQHTRMAIRRVEALNRIMQQSGKTYANEVIGELNRWKNVTGRMEYHLDIFHKSAARDIEEFKALAQPEEPHSRTSEHLEDIQASREAAAALSGQMFADPPRPIKRVDGTVTPEMTASAKQKRKPFAVASQHSVALISSKQRFSPVFDTSIEEAFRIDTWWDIPIYHPIRLQDGSYEYPEGTELHLVVDIDQTKVVGEGTNDVELVLKCVLWWKEELQHDSQFIPASVPDAVKQEFRDFCDSYDMSKAFRSIMPILCRPGLREFVQAHPQAKFWTFTNKDREDQGTIVRDVSDEDGMCGMYQDEPHEVSGRQTIDANKRALAVLDEEANRHLGIQNEERPVIGVRGQSKDLSRIAGLIQEKRRKGRAGGTNPPNTPLTIVLLDDKSQDAYAQCQANDPRMLVKVPAFTAVTEEEGVELKKRMEEILPLDKLLIFYRAFREAEPAHALVQCIDIMSDDTSTLLKRKGAANSPRFTYVPKVLPQDKEPLPPLPTLRPVVEPSDSKLWASEEN